MAMPDVVRDLKPVTSCHDAQYTHLALPTFHLASSGSHVGSGTQLMRNITSGNPDIQSVCLPQNMFQLAAPPANVAFTHHHHVGHSSGALDTDCLTSLPPSAPCHLVTSHATGTNYIASFSDDICSGPITYTLPQDVCAPCNVNVPVTFPVSRNPTTTSHNLAVQCPTEVPTSPPVLIIAKSNPKIQAAQAALQSQPQPISPTNNVYLLMMELVWHGEFDRLFAQYFPHAWYLEPALSPPAGWRVFKDSAKVRFSCKECGHGWTSMKGRVIFWFHLDYPANTGRVKFRLFGQQCQKCKNDSYEEAMWYPEEVVKVVRNVYNRVGQIFYGFIQPPLNTARREGKPKNQHNQELCQACKDGCCRGEWFFS